MIYHYTTIATLALILQYKKLRFTRLDMLDDLQEFNLYKSFPIYFSHYVSCWTEDPVENIPLWKMYTSDMRGVRIGLKNIKLIIPTVKDPSTMNWMYCDDFLITPVDHIRPCFQKIQYVDDSTLREITGKIVQKNKDVIEIGKNGLGVTYHKSLYWKFQNESRFILQIRSIKDGFNESQIRELGGEEPLEKHFDIPFLEDSFSNLQIVLGPKCTLADELIVKALLKANDLVSDVLKSELSEIIRSS